MFSSDNPFVMIFGILLGLGFITGAVYWVNKLFASNTKDLLVRFVLVIFTALVALFIVDKTIAFKVHLLGEDLNSLCLLQEFLLIIPDPQYQECHKLATWQLGRSVVVVVDL